MHTQVKTSNGIALVPLQTRHLAKRRVMIYGKIDMEAACDFADKIMLLNDESKEEPIDVYITSGGGEIRAGMMMYDVIQSSPAPVRMFCRGVAHSMAAVLFACGNHGRYLLPNSELMLHEPLLGNAVRGNVTSIRTISDELISVNAKMNELLAKHTGKTVEEIEKATSYDHFFTPEESVEFGLADAVITFEQMMGGMIDEQ